MKAAWFAVVMAWLLQVLALDGFAWLCEAGYGPQRSVAESAELPLTYAGLTLAGPVALLFVVCAIQRFARQASLRFAIPGILLFCLPALTMATLCTHTLGCVLSWW